ncbi:MAG TPA: DUF6036 family nucleotidyltransferase [Nevskia sp.]|nr:DUF6036 family nucleotidyltransferase [Nevskia sp.]
MTLDQVFKLVERARALTHHRDIVVIGSNSVLGLAEHSEIPADMAMSMDLDSYLKDDPGRTGELAKELGEGSAFHEKEGFYLDVVSPKLPTLPEGWEGRLLPIERNGSCAWFIDPDDAAISKYARGEPRDRRWIRAGLAAGLISMPKVQARLGKTSFLDQSEEAAAQQRIEEDARWLHELQSTRPEPETDEFLPR